MSMQIDTNLDVHADNAKIAPEVQAALDNGAPTITLAHGRALGWDKVIGAVVVDSTHAGVPIRALVAEKKPDGHVECITTCQSTGKSVRVHTQDLWQVVYCKEAKAEIRKMSKRAKNPRSVLKQLKKALADLEAASAPESDIEHLRKMIANTEEAIERSGTTAAERKAAMEAERARRKEEERKVREELVAALRKEREAEREAKRAAREQAKAQEKARRAAERAAKLAEAAKAAAEVVQQAEAKDAAAEAVDPAAQ